MVGPVVDVKGKEPDAVVVGLLHPAGTWFVVPRGSLQGRGRLVVSSSVVQPFIFGFRLLQDAECLLESGGRGCWGYSMIGGHLFLFVLPEGGRASGRVFIPDLGPLRWGTAAFLLFWVRCPSHITTSVALRTRHDATALPPPPAHNNLASSTVNGHGTPPPK